MKRVIFPVCECLTPCLILEGEYIRCVCPCNSFFSTLYRPCHVILFFIIVSARWFFLEMRNCIICHNVSNSQITLNALFHRSPTNYLLINLAVADIIYAIFAIPSMVLTHSSIPPNGATGKFLYTFGTFAWVGAASSIFTLVTVAVERYWSVVHPYGGSGKRLTMCKLRVCSKSNTLINVNLRQNSRHLHRYIVTS